MNNLKNKSYTQLKKEIYLRNVARRWKSELSTKKKVYILSPYMTSKTAETVAEDTQDCEIYTTFNIENFIFGTSSFTTLKNLIKKGFKIYDVPLLHAKIILVTDTFVSIGSQNLTNQGTKNKEATFTSTSLEIVRFVESELTEWLKDSKEISLETIEDFEKNIRPLKKIYKELKKGVVKAKEFIDEQEEKRKLERQREINSQKRLQRLRTRLSEIEKTQEVVSGTVKSRESYWYSSWDGAYYPSSKVMTFVPKSYNPDLLNWSIGSDKISLNKNYRYLALIEDTVKLGWAKIVKTRISKYGQGVSLSEPINLSGDNYNLYFRANWESKTLGEHNLLIDISKNVLKICKLQVFFDLDGLEIISYETTQLEELENWIRSNENHFKSLMINKLLQPFTYENNNLKSGVEADKFLEKDKTYQLKLGKINNQNLLIFSEL